MRTSRTTLVSAATLSSLLLIVAGIACSSARATPSSESELPDSPVTSSGGADSTSEDRNGPTFDDYQRAFADYSACGLALGWEFLYPPELTSRNVYDYDWFHPNPVGGRPADSVVQQSIKDLRACGESEWNSIRVAWEIGAAMTNPERQEARDFLGTCLRSKGHDLPEHPQVSDWEPFIVVESGANAETRLHFKDCQEQMRVEFGLKRGELP